MTILTDNILTFYTCYNMFYTIFIMALIHVKHLLI